MMRSFFLPEQLDKRLGDERNLIKGLYPDHPL
jgi:hypothetical protein